MNRLKLIVMTFFILLLCGCSLVYINSESIDDIINSIFSDETNLKSVSLDGYSYYLPQGTRLKTYSKSNSIIYYKKYKIYLYADLVSYYYKVENTYKTNKNSYYSRKFTARKKEGYLEINEISDNKYFIEFMYNYSKMEVLINKKDLNKTLTVMAYILNSIDYEDRILSSLVGELSNSYKNIEFNIFESNGTEDAYLDIVEQYDKNRINSKNEDILEINNDEK